MRRQWLTTVIAASVATVVSTASSGLAINVATGSPAPWFPSMNDHPLPWLAGSLVVMLVSGLVLWWAQSAYASALLITIPDRRGRLALGD